MTDAFGGSRVKVKAPERGVFPLDHDGNAALPYLPFDYSRAPSSNAYLTVVMRCIVHRRV